MQAYGTECKLIEMHASSKNCMQGHETLSASAMTACIQTHGTP